MLLQQSRIAALGEMIGNIAHQWRQPLNGIKIVASGIKFKIKNNLLSTQQLEKDIAKIIEYTDYLSQTIDDFRSFFRSNKQKEHFDIVAIVQKALSLVEASYKSHNIHIIFTPPSQPIFYYGYPNEFLQVLLNIFNNAKDILIDKTIRYVRVDIFETKKEIKIRICDNGGGVPEDIMIKIFDPYFTTKHKAQGTGLGLYMSKEIIEKHFQGLLEVKNQEFKVKEKTFYGACFYIKLFKIIDEESKKL